MAQKGYIIFPDNHGSMGRGHTLKRHCICALARKSYPISAMA
jgi:hypothetical protein